MSLPTQTPPESAPKPPRQRSARTGRARQVSLRDVAREADVSVATVSMVLNDNPRISRATQVRVQGVMRKLGYQPNRLAQSLSGKYTQVLAVLLPALRHTFADAYFGELLSGISDAAHAEGYKVLLEQAKPDYLNGRKHVELFERRYVDGVLLLGTNDESTFVADFADVDCPAVVVDNRLACPGERTCDYVSCDYAGGADQALSYLTQLGHFRIGLIGAAPHIATTRDVRGRWAKVVGNMAESLEADGEFTEEGGAAAAETLLGRHGDLTAFLALNDKMAIGAMHWLGAHGRAVPRDMSVVGFDDLRQAAYVTPSLTTIHLPLYDVGMAAVGRLLERIKGCDEPVAETLATHLVVRESTAMARRQDTNA